MSGGIREEDVEATVNNGPSDELNDIEELPPNLYEGFRFEPGLNQSPQYPTEVLFYRSITKIAVTNRI